MLVVGRPVTRAPDPRRAAEEVIREIALVQQRV
jgi:orotidine-5'-phosphate decarboxylase